MELNRREFMTVSGATLAAPLLAEETNVPWHRTIRRIGQLNMTEHDPAVMNVEEWADYWAGLKVDAVLVSVTGILAFYPTRVPFHRRAKFLGDRDFFGECCAAAKKRGLRVIARMSPDLNWKDALDAHPEWFQRDALGNPRTTSDDPSLYQTCMFTTYFTDYIPAIMREVNARYPIDGIFANAWPPFGQLPDCHCNQCKRLPAARTPAYWDPFNKRILYLWELYDGIAKEKSPENLFFGNMGGSVHASPNMIQLASVCQWYNCDNQGRGGGPSPIWGCALQGKAGYAVMKGRPVTNVTGGWCTGSPRWRNVAKSEPEARMWLDQTVASGMVPWYHVIGAEDGLGADRRWQKPGHDFYNWLASNNDHFINRRSIANLGVVMGQRTQLFYKAPGHAGHSDYLQGLYYALIEGRFPFDFIHEDDLGADTLRKYRAVLLPNIALLSDAQCAQLAAYVRSGGSLMATFETSLYNERNEPREDFGLAGLLGIHRTGPAVTKRGNSNPYLARLARPHKVLAGFLNTDWIPGADYRIPIAPVTDPVLTVVPSYPAYPPELSYPPVPQTNDPAIVVKEESRSRLIYLPGDVCRSSWTTGNTDLSRLLQNCVGWLLGGETPVHVDGDGVVETFAWETKPGFAVHLLNYTNPNLHKGYIRKFYPIGAQNVRLAIPAGTSIAEVKLLRAGQTLPFHQGGGVVEFTVPKILDYEVAALVRA